LGNPPKTPSVSPQELISLSILISDSAGIFKQSMGARNRVGKNRVVVPARQATQPGGIGYWNRFLGFLKV
jgi:hypothetical protein